MALPVQQSVLPKNSLVVNYDFSKSESYTNGSSTLNNLAGSASGHATLVGSPNILNSLGFMSFNGSSQYLVTSDLRNYFKGLNSSVQKSFTMSMWVFPTQLNGVIVSELNSQTPSGGWHASNIEIVNGVFKFRVWASSTAISSSSVSLNQWYHLALVYDGTKSKAYLNGTLLGTQMIDRELPTSYQHYAIAASETTFMGSGGYGSFNLAHFKLHQLPLTDSDILQEYEAKKGELDYIVHSPSTNVNPTYWNVSSAWDNTYASGGSGDAFSVYHYTPWLNSSLGWAAQALNTNQWITLKYDEPAYIKGIVAQGRANSGGQWVSAANIETSMTGDAPWTRVLSNKSLNVNSIEDVYSPFATPVFAKAVRVLPTTWMNHITLRMGMLVKPNNPITTSNLVLHYNPANLKSYVGSGTVLNDLTANAINGTMRNMTFSSNVLNFNGSNSDVNIADNALLEPGSGSFTIEVWFNNAGTSGTLIGKYNAGGNASNVSYALRLMGLGLIRADFGNGSTAQITDNCSFDSNAWVQMVYVWDKTNNNIYTYANGNLKQTKAIAISGSILNASTSLYIGSYNGGEYAQYFNGKLGVVRLYNKALSSSEILNNYDATKDLYDGSVLKLDAANSISYPGSGSTWNDVSGNVNNATLTDGPVFNGSNGGQFVFDGVNDFANGVAIPSTSGNNSRTVIIWYKSTANKNTILIDKGGISDDVAEQLFLVYTNSVGVGASSYPPTNNGGIALCFWGNDFIYPISASTLFDGNWHFIAYTYNKTNRAVNICFDGTFASTVYQWNLNSWSTLNSKPFISPRVLNTTNNPFWIGQSRAAFWGYGGNFGNASIPSLFMYDRALSESEILNNYNATRTRYGR